MEKMIAFCGLDCSGCPAFVATQKNDYKEKAKVAKTWSEMLKSEIKPEDINCNGCLAKTENHFSYCSTCEIRACASEKNLKNCAYCNDYPCRKLIDFFEAAPEAKANLEEITKSFDLTGSLQSCRITHQGKTFEINYVILSICFMIILGGTYEGTNY